MDLDRMFVSIEATGEEGQSPFTIVQNWRSALETR
jgi:hypothetical protein